MNDLSQKNIDIKPPPRGVGGESVVLTDSGKRFNRDWIFRHLTYTFTPGKAYAITGPNGSGKSTLLQAIAGSMHLSEGAVEYRIVNIEQGKGEQGTEEQRTEEPETRNPKPETGNRPQTIIPQENTYQYISIAAPYLDMVEEMTAKEFLHFHNQFKPLLPVAGIEEIFSIMGLEKAAGKQIRYFSSGMKQRLKLAQAVFSDVPVLLLDEPCTNLDIPGYQLYHDLINNYCRHKLIIVSSNDEQEISFCTERLAILDYR